MREGEDLTGGISAKERRWETEHINNFLMLDVAVDEGLLKKEGSKYIFAHDQIQQAAYSLTPENEQGRLHRHIGHWILKHTSGDRIDDVLFILVDQLNRGKRFIEEDNERIELSMLNLRAGRKAMSLATFWASASYLKAGID
eukprot:11251967-Ditylum_brightwellii.AAC.1